MRLFAAVVPPAEAVEHLAASTPVRDGDALRWSTPEAWHITLAFYGEFPGHRLDDLVDRLRRAARRHPPLELALAGAGRFGGRVLWVGCTGEVAGLRKLAQACGAAGRRAGADIDEQRRFRPHVTLARASRPVDLRGYVAELAGYRGPSWRASALALVRSHLGAGEDGRSRYEPVDSLELAG
jgi:RNA 2',3'-cyclic 3'-phosphodiesterase